MTSIGIDITPQISVVLCTYNRAHYLTNAIDSLLDQSFKDWELLIVDDGSQDNTFAIVNQYLEGHGHIRYCKHKNKGLGYAKNIGIQASLGRYLTFLDSDDTYRPNHLSSRLEYMLVNPDIDLIQGGFYSAEEIQVVDYYRPDRLIGLSKCVLGPTFFGKRRVFFELQGFKPSAYGEDTEFWERAEQKFKTHKLTEPKTYIYTRAESSITKDLASPLLSASSADRSRSQ
ncbi:MAG: glycosyltransferase family 2 protein [Cyanobacteriota bacterium]|jgi:glycosyltransferase involved in cell wall biosynthesis